MNKIFTGYMLAFMIAGLGCGGSQKVATNDDLVDEGPQCIDAALNLRDQVTALGRQTGVDNSEAAMVTHDLVTERCAADGWSPAAVACITTATAAQMGDCGSLLSSAQHEAFRTALATQPAAGAALQLLMTKAEPPAAEAQSGGPRPPSDPCGGGE